MRLLHGPSLLPPMLPTALHIIQPALSALHLPPWLISTCPCGSADAVRDDLQATVAAADASKQDSLDDAAGAWELCLRPLMLLLPGAACTCC